MKKILTDPIYEVDSQLVSYSTDETDETIRFVAIGMTVEDYEELGKPAEITVTIEAGDQQGPEEEGTYD